MVFIINSLLSNTYLAQPELNHIIVLDYILACCVVIIALIIIFGFLILKAPLLQMGGDYSLIYYV